MPVPAAKRQKQPVGSERPRLAPPTPARSEVKSFIATAKAVGLDPWPWQQEAARYVYALGPGKSWLYPEVAIVVARQNGKTEFLLPHILERLREGRRILHAAQTRELPRLLFNRLVPFVLNEYGTRSKIRKGAGQETIEVEGGGFYKITAASAGGPRGMTVDDLLLDEVRELDEDFIGAVLPTMVASMNPQVLYLSNAGDESTSVLNGIRARADEDPALAYLEWSAPGELTADDVTGWLYANPAIGHRPGLIDNLSRLYRSHKLAGTMSAFETEHLCRWVVTLRDRLVDDSAWLRCKATLGKPDRPAIGVSVDPQGRRAAIAIAWRFEERIGVRLIGDFKGDPVDTDAIGMIVRDLERKHGATVAHDPLDQELVKYVRKGRSESVTGQKFAAASAQFAMLVANGRLAWQDADALTDDLTWTSRTPPRHDGGWSAVRAKDDHPIPAALAAIRAVWLASQPKSEGRLVVR